MNDEDFLWAIELVNEREAQRREAMLKQQRAAREREQAIAAAKERVVAASMTMRRLEYALPTPQADRDAYDAAYDEWCAAVDALAALTEGSDGV